MATETMGKVLIVAGSKSDVPIAKDAIAILTALGVGLQFAIRSAHRHPEQLRTLIRSVDADVYIAIAGMSAALPGVIASMERGKVVIGVPVSGKDSETAMRSMVQMPPGVPVAVVALDSGKNAAILAAQVISYKYPSVGKRLREMIRTETEKTLRDAADEEAKLNPVPVADAKGAAVKADANTAWTPPGVDEDGPRDRLDGKCK